MPLFLFGRGGILQGQTKLFLFYMHRLERSSLSKRQEITVGEDVEKREFSYTPGGNVNSHNHCRKEFVGFLKS